MGLISLLSLCKVKKQVSYSQILFIGFSGMIRGAIAFGLVLTIDPAVEEREVIITTSLTLVIVTTLLFGSFMPMVQKILVPPKEVEKHEYDENQVDGEEGEN